jgi:hypothetical protein
MRNEKLFERARNLKLVTKQSVDGLFSGNYRSIFKGLGIEFDEVREYTQDDDARFIDWNVALESFALSQDRQGGEGIVSSSESLYSAALLSGTEREQKEDRRHLAALLAFAAVYNNRPRGRAFLFDRIEKFVPHEGKDPGPLASSGPDTDTAGGGIRPGAARLRSALESLRGGASASCTPDFRTGTGFPNFRCSPEARCHSVNITDPLVTESRRAGSSSSDPETGGRSTARECRRAQEDYVSSGELQEKPGCNGVQETGGEAPVIGYERGSVEASSPISHRRRERCAMRGRAGRARAPACSGMPLSLL